MSTTGASKTMQNRSQTFDVAPITTRHFLRRRARVKKIALQIRFFQRPANRLLGEEQKSFNRSPMAPASSSTDPRARVACGPEILRNGAEGKGPSIYLQDPEGNGVELKGPAIGQEH